jgi:2-methylcitrate dehydratase PrpD
MCNPQPSNYFASKYSLPHAAAVMVVRSSTHHRAIDDDALRDPAIAALMSARVPADKPPQVTLALKGGRRHTHAVSRHQGDFHAAFTDALLREKFRVYPLMC